MYLGLEFHDFWVLCAKRTNILAYFVPISKDSRVLTVIWGPSSSADHTEAAHSSTGSTEQELQAGSAQVPADPALYLEGGDPCGPLLGYYARQMKRRDKEITKQPSGSVVVESRRSTKSLDFHHYWHLR